jgi:hypothetical protein
MTISSRYILFIAGISLQLLAPSCQAFSASSRAIRPPGWIVVAGSTSSSRRPILSFCLRATIYGSDGSVIFEGDDSAGSGKKTFYAPATEPGEDRFKALIEFFQRESMDLLARLAVAFSPEERALKLKDIEHVDVLSVDENCISIEAILCENQGCVSLKVPVTFPTTCVGSVDVEGCITDNLGALDIQAGHVLSKAENPAAAAAAERELQWLKNSHDQHQQVASSLPDWWVPTPTPAANFEMAQECRVVMDLLNEDDFSKELRVLSNRAMEQQTQKPTGMKMLVRQAVVASIGLAGILLRASVQEVPLDVYDEHFVEDSKRDGFASSSPFPVRVWELPIPFGKVASTVDDLRADVLGIIATAEGVAP